VLDACLSASARRARPRPLDDPAPLLEGIMLSSLMGRRPIVNKIDQFYGKICLNGSSRDAIAVALS
jgi:hypothetical protein